MVFSLMNDHVMTIILTGGGTGGHISPVLAIAETLKHQPEGFSVLYIGKENGLEARLAAEAKIPFTGITFSGMPRKPGLAWLKWLCSLYRVVQQCQQLLRQHQAKVVFATGGYVSAPVLMAAKLLNIPYVLHEPDAHPGLVNRLMSRWAAGVTMGFAGAQSYLGQGKNHLVTGNPLRQEVLAPQRREQAWQALAERWHQPWSADNKLLYVMGGSQGAKRINDAVAEALPQLLQQPDWVIIHQTGAKNHEAYWQALPEVYKTHSRYLVQPYFNEVGTLIHAADLAICRAGAMTLAEMYLAGVPMVLVPYPFAAQDHQTKNALQAQAAGAAVMLPDSDCTAKKIEDILLPLLEENTTTRAMMRQASQTLARPEANREIVRLILQVMF